MAYGWETEITEEIMEEISMLLPVGYELVGVAVEKTDSAEAALIGNPDYTSEGIHAADVSRDIKFDADKLYVDGVNSMRKTYGGPQITPATICHLHE